MEKEEEPVNLQISQDNCGAFDREVHTPANGADESRSFPVDSNGPREINGRESPQYDVFESMVTEGDAEDPSFKSFYCVDYLEIMHEEMLNPESSNHSTEQEVADDSLDLVCKQSNCDFSTNDLDAYLKHEHEHIDGKSYDCDVCHLKFNLFSSMRNHRMSHLSQRPYKCRLCSKEFARKDILVEHLVRQHSKQKPYRCPFCPKHFKIRPQLKLHLCNEHPAAMLIKTCKLCGFKASSSSAFRNHFSVCYTKRSSGALKPVEYNLPQVHIVSSEANAIDLGAVSQNFSFVPSHYTPYAIVASDSGHPFPGPSDVTQVISLHTTSAGCSTGNKVNLPHSAVDYHEATVSPRMSSLASSTTTASPAHLHSEECPQNLVMTNVRTFVKSEPAEAVRGDDSQNGNLLPTSTMDLSVGSIVETSYSSREAVCCQTSPDLPVKIKAACSSHEDRLYENSRIRVNSSPFAGHSEEYQTMLSERCSNTPRECSCCCNPSCSSQVHFNCWAKKERSGPTVEDSESEASTHKSRKRLCQDKSTSTESSHKAHLQNNTEHASTDSTQICSRTSISKADCGDSKDNILTKSTADSGLFSCPFCEIVFPDQTLYFLHRSLHSETHPWKCNLCGKLFKDKYDFNSHIISQGHR